MFKNPITLLLLVVLNSNNIFCQSYSFLKDQLTNPRVAQAFKNKEDTLKKQFVQAKLSWPPKHIYIRSFKLDSQLEVWVRNNSKESYKLFKTYKVCALSGGLGPKRIEGDYQVPEGFYFINLFKPQSIYHLSLGINYPNSSDFLLSDSLKPGGDIYLHGSCVTVGCIPIQDNPIEELYVLTTHARQNGEDFIPVHIFPIKYSNPKSVDFLNKTAKDDKLYIDFCKRLKEVYDHFEIYKKLPVISVNKHGEYVIF